MAGQLIRKVLHRLAHWMGLNKYRATDDGFQCKGCDETLTWAQWTLKDWI